MMSNADYQKIEIAPYDEMSAQERVLGDLKSGRRLWWFGDSGPEMSGPGRAFWPQKRTVRAMLRDELLTWCPVENETHRECGIRELEAR